MAEVYFRERSWAAAAMVRRRSARRGMGLGGCTMNEMIPRIENPSPIVLAAINGVRGCKLKLW